MENTPGRSFFRGPLRIRDDLRGFVSDSLQLVQIRPTTPVVFYENAADRHCDRLMPRIDGDTGGARGALHRQL